MHLTALHEAYKQHVTQGIHVCILDLHASSTLHRGLISPGTRLVMESNQHPPQLGVSILLLDMLILSVAKINSRMIISVGSKNNSDNHNQIKLDNLLGAVCLHGQLLVVPLTSSNAWAVCKPDATEYGTKCVCFLYCRA